MRSGSRRKTTSASNLARQHELGNQQTARKSVPHLHDGRVAIQAGALEPQNQALGRREQLAPAPEFLDLARGDVLGQHVGLNSGIDPAAYDAQCHQALAINEHHDPLHGVGREHLECRLKAMVGARDVLVQKLELTHFLIVRIHNR